MSSKGRSWSWSEEAKAKAHRPRPASNGNTNGKTHGLSRTPEYNSWKKMMYRCSNPDNPDYKDYGGRGIKVTESWHDVRQFYADMGPMPKKGDLRMSIERVDVDGDYEPNNCVWLPIRMQAKNRRKWTHSDAGKEAIAEARRVGGRDAATRAKISASLREYHKRK